MPDWNAGMPHLRVRRSGRRGVPGQTLERGQGRNQVAASIKEQNCDRQINKIYRDKMVAYLSSFYGTAPTKPRNGELNSRAGCANARYAYVAPKSRRPRLWLALKPTQAFQMVVWLDMTGATDAILDCSSGSRGLSLGPEKVKTRCSIPRMSAMPALVDTNVLASVI